MLTSPPIAWPLCLSHTGDTKELWPRGGSFRSGGVMMAATNIMMRNECLRYCESILFMFRKNVTCGTWTRSNTQVSEVSNPSVYEHSLVQLFVVFRCAASGSVGVCTFFTSESWVTYYYIFMEYYTSWQYMIYCQLRSQYWGYSIFLLLFRHHQVYPQYHNTNLFHLVIDLTALFLLGLNSRGNRKNKSVYVPNTRKLEWIRVPAFFN